MEKKKIIRLSAALFCLPVFLVACGGGGGDSATDTTDTSGNNSQNSTTEASQSISSSQSGTVSLASGASVTVPVGAVPTTDSGEEGTMVFSIESDVTSPSSNIADGMILGDVFKFGPSGFNFALPVSVTLPVPNANADGLTFVTFNELLNSWIPLPGAINADDGTVSANLQHFSYMASAFWSSSAWAEAQTYNWGTLRANPLTSGTTNYEVCVDSYTLQYPDRDGTTFAAADSTMPVVRDIPSMMRLPQGVYNLQATAYDSTNGAILGHASIGSYTITADDGMDSHVGAFVSNLPGSSALSSGRAGCLATPTTTVGTGDVQVTLSWSTYTDLDLHVIDASDEEIYYGHTTSASGGALDRDHTCYSQANDGIEHATKVENIVWQNNAPAGTYTVKVVQFSDCENSGTSNFDIRVVNNGSVQTYRGSVSGSATTNEIASFTVR